MLHHSLVMTASGQYAALPDIGTATLQMLARNCDVELAAGEAKQIVGGMRSLAAHADVVPALQRLQQAGFAMATLTNSSQDGVQAQLRHAGLDGFFQQQFSVESLRQFKPQTAVYEWAAARMGVRPSECMLVAAHGWDVAGAAWAGLRTAFVAREGQQKFPLAPAPDLDVADFGALAAALAGARESRA